MKTLRLAALCALVLFLNISGSQTLAADYQLPSETLRVKGPMALEAVSSILRAENIRQLLEKFVPKQEGMLWTKYPVESSGNRSQLHLSYRPENTSQEQKPSGGSAWDYWKKIGNAASAVANAASNLLYTGELYAEVTWSDLSRVRERNTVLLEVGLGRSGLLISNMINGLTIEISFENVGDSNQSEVLVQLLPVVQSGALFPGINEPNARQIVDNQITAWTEAVMIATLEQQVKLQKQ